MGKPSYSTKTEYKLLGNITFEREGDLMLINNPDGTVAELDLWMFWDFMLAVMSQYDGEPKSIQIEAWMALQTRQAISAYANRPGI